jgi:hypothetical protein
VALWVTCTGAGADSSAAGLPSPGGSAGKSSFEGSSPEDASGALSIAVGGTSADIGAESSAATNDTLDTNLGVLSLSKYIRGAIARRLIN